MDDDNLVEWSQDFQQEVEQEVCSQRDLLEGEQEDDLKLYQSEIFDGWEAF